MSRGLSRSLSRRWDVATVGEIYVDHVFSGLPAWPQPGEEIFTREYLRELGGGAAITACGLGKLQRRTAVFGVVGADESAWMKARLAGFGVEADGLGESAGSSGVTVSVSVGDERSFYSYAGTNELLSAYIASAEVVSGLREARHVHFAVPLERSVAEQVLPELRAAGCTVSLDVGWQPAWYGKPENLRTCLEVDFFLPNLKEARHLTGRVGIDDVLLGLAEMGFGKIVVKLGGEGAACLGDGRMWRVAAPEVAVVDTTGAGDAFDAGLIDAILDEAEPLEMLRRATVCGALSVRRAGALHGQAERKDLEAV